MLSPAFHIISSTLARAEAEREMDLKELEMALLDDGSTSMDSKGNKSSVGTLSPAVQTLLKKFSAELPSAPMTRSQSISTFLYREALRRHDELVNVSEVLQSAVQTAMTLKLSPMSSYLLSFTSTKEIADESVAFAMNLTVDDILAVQDMFEGGVGRGERSASSLSSSQDGGGRSSASAANIGRSGSTIPRQFFDPSAPHNNIFRLVASKTQASSEGSAQLKALNSFTDVLRKYLVEDSSDAEEGDEYGDDASNNFGDNAEDVMAPQQRGGGMQSYLESLRRKWSALFLIWGRWSTAMALGTSGGGSSTSSPASEVNLVQLILKYLTGHVYPAFDLCLQQAVDRNPAASGTAEKGAAHMNSGKSSRRNSPTPPTVMSSPNPRNGAKAAAPNTAAQNTKVPPVTNKLSVFQQNPRLIKSVVKFQALYKGWRARRKLYPQRLLVAATTPHEKAKYFHQERHSQLFKGLLSAYREQQPALFAYLQTTAQVMSDEAKAEKFFATEEAAFNAQFKDWSKKMTKYYLEEAQLDADWAVQRIPVPMDSEMEGGTGSDQIFADEKTGARYKRKFLNIKTGIMQDENPNMLKAIAAKNRQSMKAQKDRSARLNEMNAFVERHINEVKRVTIPRLEDALSAPVYI